MSPENRQTSGLFYRGTTIEVAIGDRVRIRRFLRRPLEGYVCYVPGISEKHPELEPPGAREWAIRIDNGAFYTMGYDPAHFQPKRHIEFIARTNEPGLRPSEVIEEEHDVIEQDL